MRKLKSANVPSGSFANDAFRASVEQCPLCADSDRQPSRDRLTLSATGRNVRLTGPSHQNVCVTPRRWVKAICEQRGIAAHVVRRTKLGLSSFTECTPHCCMAARVSVRNRSSTRSTPSWPNAPKRLNLIEERLAELDYANAPGFLINGLKREQLIAMNSMILHELFFDGLGDQSEPDPKLSEALARDFGSYDRWRSEFIAMGKALGGGSGWVLLSWSPRDNKLVNQWASDHCHTLAGGTPILALDMYEHSYHADVGVKWKVQRGCRASHWRTFRDDVGFFQTIRAALNKSAPGTG